jgi:tetratricopeptide (TPR) repeat protein
MTFFSAYFRFPNAISALVFITGLFVFLTGGSQTASAQEGPSAKAVPTPASTVPPTPKEVARWKGPLTLDVVFKALRSDKTTLTERNQLLIQGIKERGISFLLTTDVEEELNEQGASKALVEIIRRETEKLQESSFFYRNRADDFVLKGNHSEAIINYNKAIELDPTDRVAYNNRGRAFEELKRYEEAFADFTKAIELDPTARTGYHNRGVIYYKMKEYQKAVSDYTKAIDIDSKFVNAYKNRANAYLMMGEKELAEADRRKAQELESN